MLLLSASQYASFTPLGADHVDGLQGRYYLPLVPAAALAVPARRGGPWPGRRAAVGLAAAAALLLAVAAVTVGRWGWA
jgi:hypothetical protein